MGQSPPQGSSNLMWGYIALAFRGPHGKESEPLPQGEMTQESGKLQTPQSGGSWIPNSM